MSADGRDSKRIFLDAVATWRVGGSRALPVVEAAVNLLVADEYSDGLALVAGLAAAEAEGDLVA